MASSSPLAEYAVLLRAIASTTLLCVLVTHLWLRRHEIREIGDLLNGLVLGASSHRSTYETLSRKTCDENRRLRACRAFARLPIMTSFCTWIWFTCAGSGDVITDVIMCFVAASMHSFMLIYPSEKNIFHPCWTALLVLGMHRSQQDAEFLLLNGFRRLLLVLFGLTAQTRATLTSNIVFSMSSCLAFWRHCRPDSILRPNQFMLMEAMLFVMTGFIFVLLDAHEMENARVSLKCRMSDRAYQAASRMLSVLCDAQVHLGAKAEIKDFTQQLSHLLISGVNPERISLQGADFLCFVSEPDRERFLDFLSASSQQQGAKAEPSSPKSPDGGALGWSTCATRPPASMQLCLCNDAGQLVPVQIFHVELPDMDDSPGHLMGFREVGSLPKEASVDAPGTVALSKRGAGPAPEPRGAGWAVQGAAPLAADELQLAPTDDGASDASASSDATSASMLSELRSEASTNSSQSLDPAASREVSHATIRVDLGRVTGPVRELSLRFRRGRGPHLSQWLPATQYTELMRQCQQVFNAAVYRGESDVQVGPLHFSCGGDAHFLSGDTVTLQAVASSAGDARGSAEEAASPEGSHRMTVDVQVRSPAGLSWLPWTGKEVAGRSGGRKRNASARPTENMPSISEAAGPTQRRVVRGTIARPELLGE